MITKNFLINRSLNKNCHNGFLPSTRLLDNATEVCTKSRQHVHYGRINQYKLVISEVEMANKLVVLHLIDSNTALAKQFNGS